MRYEKVINAVYYQIMASLFRGEDHKTASKTSDLNALAQAVQGDSSHNFEVRAAHYEQGTPVKDPVHERAAPTTMTTI